MNKMQRVEVVYKGYVQGVGFRYTARRVAAEVGIVGFARNQMDGTVLTVAEGDKVSLDAFLGYINEEMSGYIRDTKINWQPATGQFNSFEIRF